MTRAQTLTAIIEKILNPSIDEKRMQGRYHVHLTDSNGSKLFTAHASTGEQIHSVLSKAAEHVKDGGMTNIRAKVHDTFANKDYKHNGTKSADGSFSFDGPDPRKYAMA